MPKQRKGRNSSVVGSAAEVVGRTVGRLVGAVDSVTGRRQRQTAERSMSADSRQRPQSKRRARPKGGTSGAARRHTKR